MKRIFFAGVLALPLLGLLGAYVVHGAVQWLFLVVPVVFFSAFASRAFSAACSGDAVGRSAVASPHRKAVALVLALACGALNVCVALAGMRWFSGVGLWLAVGGVAIALAAVAGVVSGPLLHRLAGVRP